MSSLAFGCVPSLQGGLTLARVLTILRQAVAGLLHLHSLGILHRDLRAANLLVDGLDPLQIRVADFGVSHLLSAFSRSGWNRSASQVTSVVTGAAALGPLQVCVDCGVSWCCAPGFGGWLAMAWHAPYVFTRCVVAKSSGLPPRYVRAAKRQVVWSPPRRTCTWWAA